MLNDPSSSSISLNLKSIENLVNITSRLTSERTIKNENIPAGIITYRENSES
jgi:hypothetical protein